MGNLHMVFASLVSNRSYVDYFEIIKLAKFQTLVNF